MDAKTTENESKEHDHVTISKLEKIILNVWKYFTCTFVRLCFLVVSFFGIQFIYCIYENRGMLAIYSLSLIIVIDLFYTIFKRKGYEAYWFSTSIAAFILTMVIVISLESDFIYFIDDIECETNRTNIKMYDQCLPIFRKICGVDEELVVVSVIILVISRWLLPHPKKMNSEEFYLQTFTFTVAAADAIEIGDFMFEKTKGFYSITKGIQIVFSLSLVQFIFSVMATKKRNPHVTGIWKLIDIIFATEAWSLILAILTQEIPSFVLRVLLLKRLYEKMPQSLIFFTIKNLLMTILLTYRVVSLIKEEYKPKEKNLNHQI